MLDLGGGGTNGGESDTEGRERKADALNAECVHEVREQKAEHATRCIDRNISEEASRRAGRQAGRRAGRYGGQIRSSLHCSAPYHGLSVSRSSLQQFLCIKSHRYSLFTRWPMFYRRGILISISYCSHDLYL